MGDSKKPISVAELQAYPLFRDLTPAEIVALLGSARVRTYGGDHRLIFRQGDVADGMYVILSGEVDVFSYDVSMRKHHLGTMGEGESFGETSLLEDTRRTAGTEARDEARLIFLSKDAFNAMQATHAAALSKLFLRMLEASNKRLRMLGERYISAKSALGMLQGL
ncbi:MAG: cyclic nucleotide-binding domain-containing protein [Candidatus Riflebacteria bacterium]|nr:cyclic nucleotide-binding domain-containing protein [Candidatus Riflebacteria bacterium]